MAAGKMKYRILVAGSGDKLGELVSDLVPKSDYEVAAVCSSAAQTRRSLMENNIDLIVLNAPLRDEFGTELALDLADENYGILLIVPGDVYDQTCYKVEDYGVFTMSRPITRTGFYKAIRLITAMHAKLKKMDKKQQALKEKMKDIRTVNQAKWLLIEHLHITEADAHYFIEKKAMDTRQSRRAIAESIIKSYQEKQ